MRQVKFALTKGFRDFYPEEMAGRTWLFDKMRASSRLFGYQEYEGPALESLALYAAKSGQELVQKQTFILKDRKGISLALRPEMTPTLARMVAQKQGELVKPLRWFTIGPRWRYEAPQKGRAREFYQWDVDLIGSSVPEADAEVIAVAVSFLASVGLTPKQVKIKINSRRFLEQKLKLISLSQNKINDVFKAIDKQEKMANQEWLAYLKEIGLTKLQIEDLQGILADKDFSRESEELTALFSTLKDLGVGDWVEFDPTITRGLDYYTGTVFEARDTAGEFRAILGGGRYDNLVEVVGGLPSDSAGIGFACGDVVLQALLKKFNLWPKAKPAPARVLVTIFDTSTYRHSLQLATQLRQKGIATEIYLETDKLDKQLKSADRQGIPLVVILGPEEIAQQTVTLKNLASGQQEKIAQTKLAAKLK